MKGRRSLRELVPRTPFWGLIMHFVQRLFAGEDEQANETMSLGIGAVLALLASPGAFASLFLMDKYSPLMLWLRGIRHFDPYRASIPDEYFFIVLSMTVSGLVTVLRWNRLFPDRRDFANLAVLPVPIRNIFLANFAALFGLAVLFGIDVNGVSSFLFPAVVTMGDGSLSAFFRVAISHLAAVLSASFFSFFGVFALVGALMLFTPKRLFRPISICLRILLIVGLLTQLFSNLFLQLLAGGTPNPAQGYARLLPSIWFLGVYENVAGLANPAMARLGHEALLALLLLIFVFILIYSLCYRRHFLRLAEATDSLTGGGFHFHLRFPDALARLLFRSELERACDSFALHVLFRSERHLMFFGAYLGTGLVLVAQTVIGGATQTSPATVPNAALLAAPLMIAFFVITGLRFVFDMPAVLNANWIFRLSIKKADPPPNSIVRRLMLLLIVPCEILLVAPFTAYRYGWLVASEHAAAVIVLTVLAIELVSMKFHKIPFTCSKEPDIRQFLFRIVASGFAVMIAVPLLADLEHWMLLQPIRLTGGAVSAAIAWIYLRRYRRAMLPEDTALKFEDRAASQFELLKLA